MKSIKYLHIIPLSSLILTLKTDERGSLDSNLEECKKKCKKHGFLWSFKHLEYSVTHVFPSEVTEANTT